jgi:hypothetical protein
LLPGTEDDLVTAFDEISNKSELLRTKDYRNTVVCSGISASVLVPNTLYLQQEAVSHLIFAQGHHPAGTVISDDMKHTEAKNIFSIPDDVFNWLISAFPHGQIHHMTTAMADYLLWAHRGNNEDIITVQVYPAYAEIIVNCGKNLNLLNRFEYSTAEELVYYILFIMEQLQLNPDHVPVVFAGTISAPDQAYQLSCKYIRNVSFALLPDLVTGAEVLEDIPAHTCFHIFCQQICVS